MSFINKQLLRCLTLGAISLSFADYEDSQTQSSNEQVITPSASPVVKHGFDLYLFGDFIYWTARVDTLQENYEETTYLPSFSSETIKTKNHLNPGFKVGAGMNFEHDGWDSLVRYTWLRTSSCSQVSGNNFTSGTIFFSENDYVGKKKLKIHFNAVDWELGRNFYISQQLLLRPFIGFKGAWNRQNYFKNSSNLNESFRNSSLTYEDLFSYSITLEQNFWGIGIRPGLETSWQFTSQWSIFGETSLSALWGQFKNTQKEHQKNVDILDPSQNTDSDVSNISRSFYTISPVMEFLIGLRWDYKFSDDDYRIRIQAGWEEQVWFNQNQFNIPSNLVLQGLTVNFRFDF